MAGYRRRRGSAEWQGRRTGQGSGSPARLRLHHGHTGRRQDRSHAVRRVGCPWSRRGPCPERMAGPGPRCPACRGSRGRAGHAGHAVLPDDLIGLRIDQQQPGIVPVSDQDRPGKHRRVRAGLQVAGLATDLRFERGHPGRGGPRHGMARRRRAACRGRSAAGAGVRAAAVDRGQQRDDDSQEHHPGHRPAQANPAPADPLPLGHSLGRAISRSIAPSRSVSTKWWKTRPVVATLVRSPWATPARSGASLRRTIVGGQAAGGRPPQGHAAEPRRLPGPDLTVGTAGHRRSGLA